MKTKYFFLIAFFALFSTTIVSAQNTESLSGFISLTPAELNKKGEALYGNGQYAEAIQCFRTAAEQGHASAQHSLGWFYFNGKGVSQDYKEAAKWARKAAEQGHAVAQFDLGYCYANGIGTEKNENEAIKWYRKAAEQGYHNAQYEMGSYEFGKGVIDAMCFDIEGATDHYMEAFEWYLKASKQGHMEAQYEVGYCYEFGKGTAKNLDEAIKWYKKAAEQGHMEAKEALQKLQNR